MTMAEKSIPHQIPRAHDILDAELTRTTTERDALRQFRARCTQINPTTPDSTPASQSQATPSGLTGVIQSVTPFSGSGSGSHARPSSGGTLQQVCEAYRETVIVVPHYGEEYDEPLDENLATEVGDDLGPRGPHGYYGDLSRTFVCGDVGNWERDAYDAVFDAFEGALDVFEEGAGQPVSNVQDRVVDELSAHGFKTGDVEVGLYHGARTRNRIKPSRTTDSVLR